MSYWHDDWLRDQGIFPGIKLGKIRFGHRVDPRKKLAISFMGQPVAGSEKPLPKANRERRDDQPGYEEFQLRLW